MSKSGETLGSGGHGIRLWFALAGVVVGCPFSRPRGAIQMIEMIQMIQVIRGPAGREYVAQGRRWEVESMTSWSFRRFGSGGGHGICLWFRRFCKIPNACFSDSPPFSNSKFSILRGEARFSKSAT